MSSKSINLTLKVWRQQGPKSPGRLETYKAENISTDASFLEMLDIVNERLTLEGKEPIFNKEPLNFEFVKLATRSYK